MRKEIGFIAVGQAGGNIGKLLEKKGYSVLYINTSLEDLGTLEDSAHKFHMEGGEGCNKDRTKAKKVLAGNLDRVLEQVRKKLPQKIIFIIFSAGGGTGSGTGPVLTGILQQEMEKTVGAVTILPSEEESVKAHVNAYECVKELADIPEMGTTFFLDNNTIRNKMRINEQFTRLLDNFICIPDRRSSALGNIDRAEIKEVLGTKGAAVICCLSRQKSGNNAAARIIEAIRKGIFAETGETRAVKYITILAAGGLGSVDTRAIQTEFGTAYDIFQGYEADRTLCCLCGLRFPFGRMEEIKDRAMKNQGAIVESIKAVSDNPMSDGLDLFASVKKPDKKKGNSRDLLKQFL